MPEHVVEDVGFLNVIELVGPPNEVARHEPAIRHMVEEHVVGDQAGHRDHLPAGEFHQPVRQFLEIGNAGFGEFEDVEPAQERLRCATRQQFRLTFE